MFKQHHSSAFPRKFFKFFAWLDRLCSKTVSRLFIQCFHCFLASTKTVIFLEFLALQNGKTIVMDVFFSSRRLTSSLLPIKYLALTGNALEFYSTYCMLWTRVGSSCGKNRPHTRTETKILKRCTVRGQGQKVWNGVPHADGNSGTSKFHELFENCRPKVEFFCPLKSLSFFKSCRVPETANSLEINILKKVSRYQPSGHSIIVLRACPCCSRFLRRTAQEDVEKNGEGGWHLRGDGWKRGRGSAAVWKGIFLYS